MAILDDDFQGYAIGTNLPFGSWIGSGFTAQIQSEPSGTGIPGTDRAFNLGLGLAEYVNASYISSFTEWVAIKLGDSANAQTTLSFANGPNALGQTFTLLSIRIEPDSTITALDGVTGAILANSGDVWFRFHTMNFLQVNVIFSDVLVLGVSKINIQCEVAINGVVYLNFNITTTAGTAALTHATAEVNRFQLNGGTYGAFTLDALTAIVSYPHPGTPHAVAVQAPIEVDLLLNSGVIDAYQSAVEVDVLPDSGHVLAYQMVVEVDILAAQRWYISES